MEYTHQFGGSQVVCFEKRLKAIIKAERYSQRKFAEMVGMPLSSLERYLSGKQEPSTAVTMKILNHPEFKKYTIWLMIGETDENSGQVCPDFSTQEQCGLVNSDSQKQA